ncbi:MAG: pyridoxamine 5'-phosphate oxidase [Pseudomonadota bacterium]
MRDGIFAGDDPFELTRTWLAVASEQEIADANAMALATVDKDGLPNVRVVLLKAVEADAFVFYTNYQSAKGQELIASRRAAFNIHWKSIGRQIRARGLVEKEDGKVADEYYRSRALQSRIGAWASRQSEPLASRSDLEAEVKAAEAEHGDDPRRPPFWGGFRLRPLEMEFWSDGAFRLHDRFRWQRADFGAEWQIERLNP